MNQLLSINIYVFFIYFLMCSNKLSRNVKTGNVKVIKTVKLIGKTAEIIGKTVPDKAKCSKKNTYKQ